MKTSRPDLIQTLENFKKNHLFADYHFHKIGIIDSVDFTKAICKITIAHQYLDKSRNIKSRPVISCPIKLNYTNSGGIKHPIKRGDYCIIAFNDVSIDEWFRNGAVNLPVSTRQHHIADAVAIPFIFASNSTLPPYTNDNTEVFYEDKSQIVLKDKITISNNSADIKTILDSLITDYNEAVKNGLSALVVTSPVGPCIIDPASASSILDSAKDNVLANINNLFE